MLYNMYNNLKVNLCFENLKRSHTMKSNIFFWILLKRIMEYEKNIVSVMKKFDFRFFCCCYIVYAFDRLRHNVMYPYYIDVSSHNHAIDSIDSLLLRLLFLFFFFVYLAFLCIKTAFFYIIRYIYTYRDTQKV